MLGALAGLIGAIVQAGAAANAQASQERMAEKELDFQEKQADRQEQLMTATRKDALGNKLQYSELGGFETILAPIVQAIVDANKEEQYKSLTMDAPRNRDARVRADERSKLADDAYTKAFDTIRNKTPVDEGAAQMDAVEQALRLFRSGPSNDAGTNAAAIQAVRQGTPAPRTSSTAVNSPNKADMLAATVAEAKKSGKMQALAENNATDAVDMQKLGQLFGLANQAPQANLMYSNDNEVHRANADQAIAALQNVLAQNAGAIGNSMRYNAEIAGQVPDYMSIFQSLGGLLNGLEDKLGKSKSEKEMQQLAMQQAGQEHALDAMKVYGGFQDTMTPEDFLSTMNLF